MTRIALNSLTWHEDDVHELISYARRIVEANGNRRGVCKISCVTDSQDVVKTYGVKLHRDDASLLGCCYYHSYWDGNTRTTVRAAVIRVAPHAPHTDARDHVRTLAHEIAHALTTGSHGYTWRRMYALILPFAGKIFDFEYDMWDEILKTINRYGVRYESSWVGSQAESDEDGAWLSRMKKIEIETAKHITASLKMFKKLGGDKL